MLRKNILLLLLAFTALVSCEKEEAIIKPTMEIGEATNITNRSAMIHAQVAMKGTMDITEYGFLWQETPINTLFDDDIQREVLSTPFEEGAMATEITDLELGATYYYKAYARTATDVYYSPERSFNTLAPTIESISPAEGAVGTITTLTGKYFTADISQLRILVNGIEVKELEATETQIRFAMPKRIAGTLTITAMVGGVSSDTVSFNYLSNFTFSPKAIEGGSILVVTVSNWRWDNQYKIGGIDTKPMWNLATPEGLAFGLKVPESLPPGETTLEVFDAQGNPLLGLDTVSLTVLPI